MDQLRPILPNRKKSHTHIISACAQQTAIGIEANTVLRISHCSYDSRILVGKICLEAVFLPEHLPLLLGLVDHHMRIRVADHQLLLLKHSQVLYDMIAR